MLRVIATLSLLFGFASAVVARPEIRVLPSSARIVPLANCGNIDGKYTGVLRAATDKPNPDLLFIDAWLKDGKGEGRGGLSGYFGKFSKPDLLLKFGCATSSGQALLPIQHKTRKDSMGADGNPFEDAWSAPGQMTATIVDGGARLQVRFELLSGWRFEGWLNREPGT